MIARDYITAWRQHAPWVSDHQVEQDLVISRALAQIFSVAEIGRRLAFRGDEYLGRPSPIEESFPLFAFVLFLRLINARGQIVQTFVEDCIHSWNLLLPPKFGNGLSNSFFALYNSDAGRPDISAQRPFQGVYGHC